MITEDYCSFELSKLLKEKGFDGPCYGIWHVGNKLFDVNYEPLDYSELREERLLAPTHQMAMKWLREEHKLHIDIDPSEGDWSPCVIELENWSSLTGGEIAIQDTYEEAVEAAIKYALENLI